MYTKCWALIALLFALEVAGCDPFHTGFEDVEPALMYEASAPVVPDQAPTTLKVMTWNVKFGGGRIDFFFDCFGDRVLMSSAEVEGNIEAIAAVVRDVDPDVLLVQEIDINSRRGDFLDQLQLLLDSTPLNYAAYGSQWRADYVPSDGLGAIDSGSAILSRWPLGEAERVALPLRTDQDGLTRYFYLRRNYLRAQLSLPGRDPLWVVNIHTDAYGKDGTKRAQIDLFHEELVRLGADGGRVIGGGDLNAIPPGSTETGDFPDSVCEDVEFQTDDYAEEADWLDALYADFTSAITLEEYAADNAVHYTHTVDGGGFWNRKLDYLFTNGTWLPGSGRTLQSDAQGGHETMPLSDHAPVVVEMELP
jgi:endonuclease/exonuclease/phosphatase family metal-dependent hydrolase